METVERIEEVVRRLMQRPAAVGLPADFDFALLLRDLKRELLCVGEVDLGVKAHQIPARTATGCFRIECPPTVEGEKTVIPRLYGRIEDGRISRTWRCLHSQ